MAPALRTVADGVHIGALLPRHVAGTVVLDGPDGTVVVDAGLPWSGRRLARFLRGRDVTEHVVTHAHGDHVGATAWLCAHTGAPLAMSAVEADDFEDGTIDFHAGAPWRYLVAPLGRRRRTVDRRLREGDTVAGFRVLAQPGHSPGLLAFWRESDRTLVVGDGPINVSAEPTAPRWLPIPRSLHQRPDQATASRWKLADLRPDLIVSTHGFPVRGVERWTEGLDRARP